MKTKFSLLTNVLFGDLTPGISNNDNTATIPEFWSKELLALLVDKAVMPNLVWRDVGADTTIRSVGQTVNVTRPTAVGWSRQVDGEDIDVSNAETENVQVTLDQKITAAVKLYGNEMALSMQDLSNLYLAPLASALSLGLDHAVIGRFITGFGANGVGQLGVTPTSDTILKARLKLRKAHAPRNQWLALSADTETDLLALDEYNHADITADGGLALREAMLGRKHGFNIFSPDTLPSLTTTAATADTTTTAAAIIGATTIDVADATGFEAGQYILITGDNRPRRITNVAALVITLDTALTNPVSSGADVSVILPATINQSTLTKEIGSDGSSAGYRAGWHKAFVVTPGAAVNLPEPGALVSFGTSSERYLVAQVVGNTFYLDRPLATAVADGSEVFFGPTGSFNMAFVREAVGLVTRAPMVTESGVGVQSFVDSWDGFSVRLERGYDMSKKAMMLTAEIICGTQIMYPDFAVPVYG